MSDLSALLFAKLKDEEDNLLFWLVELQADAKERDEFWRHMVGRACKRVATIHEAIDVLGVREDVRTPPANEELKP